MMVVAVEPQAQRDEVCKHGVQTVVAQMTSFGSRQREVYVFLPESIGVELDVVFLHHDTGDETADTPEAVDTHAGGHGHGRGV